MTHHSELINYIIKTKGLKSYLEIGTFNRAHNFDKIEIEEKYCVDPDPNAKADFMMTSDKYFEFLDKFNVGGKFDIIWIDGLHEAVQVVKDCLNGLRYLSQDGYILFHDCNPPTEITTCIPRGAQREWCGDVYKAIMAMVAQGEDIITVDMDYGCAVYRRGVRGLEKDVNLSWASFEQDRKAAINLISLEDFYKWI